jgi:Ca2+-binding EF-hand superfamily protein
MFAALLVFGVIATGSAQQSAATKAQDNLAKGEDEVKPLLLLMDQDKDGKVSKQEFMKFMEAEFERLDKKNEGKLNVKELTKPPEQPIKGFRK